MKKLRTLLLSFASATALGGAEAPAPSRPFTLDRVLDYALSDTLIAAPAGRSTETARRGRSARRRPDRRHDTRDRPNPVLACEDGDRQPERDRQRSHHFSWIQTAISPWPRLFHA